jgi:hypothetical protein
MESLVPYAMYLVLGLTGLGLVAIALFGVRNLAYGKVSIMTLVLSSFPIVIMIVLGFVLDDWSAAGIWTTLISLVFTSGALLISGSRGLVGR